MNAAWWDAKFRETAGAIVGWVGWKTGNEFRAGTQRLVDLLTPHLDAFTSGRKVETLLDFGCGWGRLAPFLLKYAERYVGVDISPEMIHRAQQTMLLDTQYYTAEAFLPAKPGATAAAPSIGPVNLAVTITVLHHCTGDDERALALKRLDACHPTKFFLYEQSGGDPHPHCRPLSVAGLEAALPGSKFRIAFSDVGGGGRPHSLFLGERDGA